MNPSAGPAGLASVSTWGHDGGSGSAGLGAGMLSLVAIKAFSRGSTAAVAPNAASIISASCSGGGPYSTAAMDPTPSEPTTTDSR